MTHFEASTIPFLLHSRLARHRFTGPALHLFYGDETPTHNWAVTERAAASIRLGRHNKRANFNHVVHFVAHSDAR